ncbi:hypothetical protein IRJ41_009135 [Triplophysa rosa]|uniref:ZP domain-containing protein n=1 Tax=Triplophysa rosa TaxID=992332 RepID=A0A9W7WDA0_TRIRA|nr:hypothetical protein IRJ41_009135 [Triplophysa rosa]
MRFLISLCVPLLLLVNGEIINGQTSAPTTSSSDPCYNYTIINDFWRDVRQNQYYSNNDNLVDWNGWYRFYLNGASAQMSEWCVSYAGCGGETALFLSGSHPKLEDVVVTRAVSGNYQWNYYSQCGNQQLSPIQVKACPGHYYIYKLVKPDMSVTRPSYCAVTFNNTVSDPCYNYESLDRPWRASNESGFYVCDESFSWNGWHRLFYNGMNIRMPESCVNYGRCNTYFSLWLNGPHPHIQDGVVTREICASSWMGCCNMKSTPIRVKACPGDYYVYEFVKPPYGCSGYCTAAISSDPCNDYNILEQHWRSTFNYWNWNGYDDTRVKWDGWYRLFINGSSAQMPEWCFSYMTCGGFSSLWLGGPHPKIHDGFVTREVYGTQYVQCSYYRSKPIQVKACPGNYHVYKLPRPKLSIPHPVYCAVPFSSPNIDPCYSYTSLDEPWRASNSSYISYTCDYNVTGWHRLFYSGLNAQMPESCVGYGMCGSYIPLWLNGSHPQLEDGVVTREVCMSLWHDCCAYKSHPIRVKACPGNYYVYQFVIPMYCGTYCTDVEGLKTTSVPITTVTNPLKKSITVPGISVKTAILPFDPCNTYTVLDEPWRATSNKFAANLMCDASVSWSGWYRLFIRGHSVQMPDTCVDDLSCGTHAPLWLNGPHPRIEDGVVTRDVCGNWFNNCCFFRSNSIQVKACPGNYYVYEFTRPSFCYGTYCAGKHIFVPLITTLATTTTFSTTTGEVHSITGMFVRDPCSDLNCTENEWCGEHNGVYGCFCNQTQPTSNPDTFDAYETCESSSGFMSLSRCQLFEAGFSADVLHLNDPSCRGTVQNERVEFRFDNNGSICGTGLVANGTHIIYENFIFGQQGSAGGVISRKKFLKLRFNCVYHQTHSVSMDINPLESIVHRNIQGLGTYRVRMLSYQDAQFSKPFTGSVSVEVDQKIFVEVRVDGVDGHRFASVIDTCWATPANDPQSSLLWDLIVDECPNPNDNTVELLQNGVSTSSRFSFRMFIFTAYSTKVYLHCKIHLCLLTNNTCSSQCQSGQHLRVGRSLDFHDTASISMGPLVWSKETQIFWPQNQ